MRFLLPACLLTIFFLFLVVRPPAAKLQLEDLTGHWHLVRERLGHSYDLGIYQIGPDTNLIGLYLNDTAGVGAVSATLDTLYLPDLHGWQQFVVTKVSSDRLTGKWLADTSVNVYLQRFSVDTEHLRNDYFGDERVAIELPLDSAEHFSTQALRGVLMHPVYLGTSTKDGPGATGQLTLRLRDQIRDLLDPTDVLLHTEQHRVKLPENLRPLIKPTFFFDRSVPEALVTDFQQYYAAVGYDTTYLAYEVPADSGAFRLSFERRIAPPLPDSVTFLADPTQLLCLGISTAPRFTSGVATPDASKRTLPDSLGYGGYYFHHGSPLAYELQVAFYGPADLWRANHQGQHFVAATFDTPAYRLWNGLQVGQPIRRYAHLAFTAEGKVYRREEGRYSYTVTTSPEGLITSVRVYANYFWLDKGLPNTSEPWMPHLRGYAECRLRSM